MELFLFNIYRTEKVPKSSIKYECKMCDYTTIRKNQYDGCLTTAKHQN